jgi:hypothetical protein
MTDKNIDLKLVKVGTVRKHMDAHFRDEISYSEAVNRINQQANKNMKAKLIFDLPEDKYEYEMASKGSKWYNVAWDMYQYLRQMTKYAPDGIHKEYLQAMYECKDELFKTMEENGVDFDL